MRPYESKGALDRALRRLGSVSPEVLAAARERIRRNLKTEHLLTVPLPPTPDAAPPNLGALRRPFQVAAVAAACVLIAIGAVMRWNVSNVLQRPVQVGKLEGGPPSTRLARFTLLPPGDGKVILDRACGGCHRAEAVGSHRFTTRAEYAALVSRMIGMGAPVTAQEVDVLVDYLFDNLQIKPEPPVETAGRAVLNRACTSCHSLNGIEKYAWSSEGSYRELVSTMVSYGAVLTDEEKGIVIRYLFTTYGKR